MIIDVYLHLFVLGLLFGFNFSVAYTCARTLAIYYNYDALKTGLVLLAYGIGEQITSIKHLP